jgi:hypothetical protein
MDERVDERAKRISALLHEAGETHHVVFRITDGDDPDWASWYSEWLTRLSELPQILGTDVVRSELTYMLVKLDKDFASEQPGGAWEDYYGERLVEYFAA